MKRGSVLQGESDFIPGEQMNINQFYLLANKRIQSPQLIEAVFLHMFGGMSAYAVEVLIYGKTTAVVARSARRLQAEFEFLMSVANANDWNLATGLHRLLLPGALRLWKAWVRINSLGRLAYMDRITSKGIKWSHGMTLAVVSKFSNTPRIQCNMLLTSKGNRFSLDGEWLNHEVYYIVKR